MNTILKPSIIIGIVAFIASLLLSHVRNITEPHILRQAKEKQERALAMVLPGYEVGEKEVAEVNGTPFVYWKGMKGDDEAYAFETSKPGYSGDIISVVGVTPAGEILGLSILQQTETPGLGARSTEVASSQTFFGSLFGSGGGAEEGEKRPWFQQQFQGLSVAQKIAIVKKGDWNESMKEELQQKNAVSAITGSTITTATVRDSVMAGYEKLTQVVDLSTDDEGKEPDETGDNDRGTADGTVAAPETSGIEGGVQ